MGESYFRSCDKAEPFLVVSNVPIGFGHSSSMCMQLLVLLLSRVLPLLEVRGFLGSLLSSEK
jgi:hypothetical protein